MARCQRGSVRCGTYKALDHNVSARWHTALPSLAHLCVRLFTLCRISIMLNIIVIVLIVLWLLGMVSAYTMGGLIHVLLVIAVIVVLVRVIQGRRPI